jgi:hypothetical protein
LYGSPVLQSISVRYLPEREGRGKLKLETDIHLLILFLPS